MNVDELKIKALLEGLEAQNIEEFMREAKVGDYRNYGKAYFSAVRNKIEEKEPKPLFITEDGVSIYTNNIELFAVNDMFETASSTHFDFDVSRKDGWKLFYHESNADEYIWRNKPVFSYKDIQNYGVHPVNMIRVEQLAKERSKE